MKEYNDINVQDGINSEELKDAIKESDLKGLKQIRTELDAQDLKTAMEFFGKAEKAERQHLHSLEHPELPSNNIGSINNEMKPAEDEDQKSKDDKNRDKANVILRILELMSKRKGSTAYTNKNLKDENKINEKEYEDNKNNNNGNTSLEDTARKIEEFINLDKENKVSEVIREDKETISPLSVSKKPKETSQPEVTDDNIFGSILQNNLQNLHSKLNDDSQLNGKPKLIDANKGNLQGKINTESKEKEDPSQIMTNPHSATIELIQNLFKTKKATNEENLVLQKILGGGGGSDISEPLQINGGKVLGGNVRGGRILGGIITGGNITGGEMEGGRITGGTFKDGLFINGLMSDGLIEGGKIRGGKIMGGVIKAGVIDGGIMKGGVMLGGHLINGTIAGGLLKGGEIDGGEILSGEMDGGTLKGGRINGGIMKGGIIESGSLDGGLMLSGIIRGGIVKSGIIKGGIVDKGVVVQDAEIGPGVEIHEGIIKGGRITANDLRRSSSHEPGLLNHIIHSDENRSNIMYSIEVTPTKDGVNTIDESQDITLINDKENSNLEDSLDMISDTSSNTEKKTLNIKNMMDTVNTAKRKISFETNNIDEFSSKKDISTLNNTKNDSSSKIKAIQLNLDDKDVIRAANDDPNLKRLLAMMQSPIEKIKTTEKPKTTTTTRKSKLIYHPLLTFVICNVREGVTFNNYDWLLF